jgi:hypothetical protein
VTKKQRGKNKQVETRRLVGFALLSALGGVVVAGAALATRTQVSGVLDGVLVVVAVIGTLYAAMWIGGAAMFLFFDQLFKDPERGANWYWGLAWLATFLSVPSLSYLLNFDRDQWIWGTGSTVVGLIILLVVVVRPQKQS